MIRLNWKPRTDPLPAGAVLGEGEAAVRLVRRLLNGYRDNLRGLAADDQVVIIGKTEDLPWVDGVQYLGKDPRAPALLLPTMLNTAVPISLVERALILRAQEGDLPLVVTPSKVIACGNARPLDVEQLHRWLA
ncbi:MAG: hypothetical protein AAFV53_40950 [Myxococcota bacterium]